MPIDGDKIRILIATTNGPVEVLLLTEEDENIGRSVACVGGTTDTADIDAAYHAFVARPTGLVARLFGHSCFRMDLSARIDAGSSWQLGVLAAHALHAAGRLAQEKDAAGSILWASGSVRSVDLTVGAVSHLDEKMSRSLDRLGVETAAGLPVLMAIPSTSSNDVSEAMRAALDARGVTILEIAHVKPLWDALQLKLAVDAPPPASRLRAWMRLFWPGKPRQWRLSAGVIGLAVIALAVGLAVEYPLSWRSGGPRDTRLDLLAALARQVPSATRDYRARVAEDFVKSKLNRAMAVAPRGQRTMRTSGWATSTLAEEKALERCQQFYDEPCALLATNEFIVSGDPLPLRDSPRVRYSGSFNPEKIPGVGRTVERRSDVAHYLVAASPKASAYHSSGILHVVTGAPSQYEAEEQVLRACNADPARTAAGGGPCYLYSIDNRVVLALRSTAPITQPVAMGPSSYELLLTRLRSFAPAYPNAYRQVREYLESAPHKALTALSPSHSWRTSGGESAEAAEQRGLEACQLRFARPCTLLAVDEAVRPLQSSVHWQPRPMARLSYHGLFDPAQIPAITEEMRRRSEVVGYRSSPNYKAASLHPWGRLFLVTGKGTQREAEQGSLDACNGDSDRNGKDGPCLLYAVGDLVVLHKRLAVPSSPQ